MTVPSARRPQRGKDRTPRRRRDSATAERELLDAAEALLGDAPLRDLTPLTVTARAGMARSSFYVYFDDVPDLVVKLAARLQEKLAAMTDLWVEGTPDPLANARQAVEGVVTVFREHGRVLRAMADASPTDARVEQLHRDLVLGFVDVTERMILAEQAAGRIVDLPAHETAGALIWMNERFLSQTYGRTADADPEPIVDALLGIWVRALYGRDPS